MAQVQNKVVSSEDRHRLYRLVPVDMMIEVCKCGEARLVLLDELLDIAEEVANDAIRTAMRP